MRAFSVDVGDQPTLLTQRFQHKRSTVICLCFANALEHCDQFGLTGLYLAMMLDLEFGPSGLASIVIAQNVCMALVGPVWGWLADNTSRIRLLTISCLLTGACNLFSAAATSYTWLIVSRGLLGATLGALMPIAQTLVYDFADESPNCKGRYFGYFSSAGWAGAVSSTFLATWASEVTILGVPGWRFALGVIGASCFVVGIVTSVAAREPPRVVEKTHRRSASGAACLRTICLDVLALPTYWIIAIQGVVGTAAGQGFIKYTSLYFQYAGFSDALAGLIGATLFVGGIGGGIIGGYLGDCMAARLPRFGRVLVTQVAVAYYIMDAILMFRVLTPDSQRPAAFFALQLCGGLFAWPMAATIQPVFGEVVLPKHRAQVLAWEQGVAKAFGALLGTPIVAYFANANGFVTYTQPVSQLTPQQMQQNVDALGFAITRFCVPMWLLCIAIWCPLGFTYPRDVARVRAKLEKQHLLDDQDAGVNVLDVRPEPELEISPRL